MIDTRGQQRQIENRSSKCLIVEISAEPLSMSSAFAEIWISRELFVNLLLRNLKGRYRGTFLGNWWLLIHPVIGILPYFIVFGLFMRVSTHPLPYIVFLVSGFGAWQLFGTQITASPGMMLKMRSMVERIYFPRLIVPLVDLLTRILDYAVIMVAAVLVGLAFGVLPTGPLWAFPLFTLLLLVLSFGSSLVVTTICTLWPDLTHGVPAGTRLLFYASAVFYPLSVVPEWIRPWFELNPIMAVIAGLRWSAFGYFPPSLPAVAFATFFAVGVLWLGLYMFLRVERRLADLL